MLSLRWKAFSLRMRGAWHLQDASPRGAGRLPQGERAARRRVVLATAWRPLRRRDGANCKHLAAAAVLTPPLMVEISAWVRVRVKASSSFDGSCILSGAYATWGLGPLSACPPAHTALTRGVWVHVT